MKSIENSLENKVAIVTGGTRGIGRAITETFLEAGAKVLVCARTLPESDISISGRKAHFVSCDVRNTGDMKEVVELCESKYGKLDILVNNAGGAPPALLTRISNLPYLLSQSSTTSFMSPVLRTSQLTKCAFLPEILISDSGRVRAHTSTFAPASRNVSVIALPIPLVPPVTIATLFSKLFSILFTIRP